jgi:hypothetical protein
MNKICFQLSLNTKAMKNLKNLILLIFILLLNACAIGNKMTLKLADTSAAFDTLQPVVIVFKDARPEILNNSEKPTFMGHVSSMGQVGYSIQTLTGMPLADEFATSVCNSVIKKGSKAVKIFVNHNASDDSIINLIKGRDEKRLAFFTINKWDASSVPGFSKIHYEVISDLVLKVYNENGELMVSTHTSDDFKKEQGAVFYLSLLQSIAENFFVDQIRKLCNSESVKNSLKKEPDTFGLK